MGVLGDFSAVASSSGTEILVSSGPHGSYSMNGVPLAPTLSVRPRPEMLTLRVLVDRSIIESFAQDGRATHSQAIYVSTNKTALVWRPNSNGSGSHVPQLSIRIWSMKTGFVASSD